MDESSKSALASARRIVVKIGSRILVDSDRGGLREGWIEGFAASVARLRGEGREAILVTSGAVGAGMAVLGYAEKPESMAEKQACAAVGQIDLMHAYRAAFSGKGLAAAQILLTAEDFRDRHRYRNLQNALGALLTRGVVPIINENDSVATAEIKVGDNDKLSADVAMFLDADFLLVLTDEDGLFDANPKTHPEARLVESVPEITEEALARPCGHAAGDPRGGRGRLSRPHGAPRKPPRGGHRRGAGALLQGRSRGAALGLGRGRREGCDELRFRQAEARGAQAERRGPRHPRGGRGGRGRADLFIYESRPDVTVDGAALCVKSGNPVILRCGTESSRSSAALAGILRSSLAAEGLGEDCVQLVGDPDRAVLSALLSRSDAIDLVIPRGGEGLIRAVAEQSRIPVIKHYKGVCHVFVERSAAPAKARAILLDAKTGRTGTCNAMETVLLDRGLPRETMLDLVGALSAAGVTLGACDRTRALIPGLEPMGMEGYRSEYLALRASVRVVDDIAEAVAHVEEYGSGHTDAIVSEDQEAVRAWLESVDSSSVMANASTRLADGGQYGLGAEVGISTDRLHARGPMGVESLTTYKWVVWGEGHTRG